MVREELLAATGELGHDISQGVQGDPRTTFQALNPVLESGDTGREGRHQFCQELVEFLEASRLKPHNRCVTHRRHEPRLLVRPLPRMALQKLAEWITLYPQPRFALAAIGLLASLALLAALALSVWILWGHSAWITWGLAAD